MNFYVSGTCVCPKCDCETKQTTVANAIELHQILLSGLRMQWVCPSCGMKNESYLNFIEYQLVCEKILLN